MRNITVTVADELYEPSRMMAAQRKTTVTGRVRDYLKSLAEGEARQEQARKEILARIGTFGGKVGRMPSREERDVRGQGID